MFLWCEENPPNSKYLEDMEICDEGVQLAHVGKVSHEIPNLQMVITFPHCIRDDVDKEDCY